MSDLKRIYLITRHFDELQGLKSAAVGFFLVMFWVNGIGQAIQGNLSLGAAEFVIGIAVYTSLTQMYEEKYGMAKRRKTWVEIIVIVVSIALVMLADWIDVELALPVSLTGLMIAVGSLLIWQFSERFRHQYVILAIIVAVASFLPLIFGDSVRWSVSQGDGILLLGFVGIFGGVIDHLILAQSFSMMEKEIPRATAHHEE